MRGPGLAVEIGMVPKQEVSVTKGPETQLHAVTYRDHYVGEVAILDCTIERNFRVSQHMAELEFVKGKSLK